jgi:alpha,alpha-trehalase
MAVPIGDYALLSDSQGAALVSRSGSIDWACLPRFDAPSTFARLLDPGAGHWLLSPVGIVSVEREYLPRTMVLRTESRTTTGSVSVTDALVFEPLERGHGIGHRSPHTIVRLLEGLEGHVEMEMELAPRPEYGTVVPHWDRTPGGAEARGGPLGYVASAPVELDLDGGTIRSRFTVRSGQRLGFALQAATPWDGLPGSWSTDRVRAWLHGTIRAWRSWSDLHQAYEGPYADLVHHSGRVLQALTYAPTGAVIAAPTTSLPEAIGKGLNWDYRYSWVRDASLTLNALWVAACPDEVERFFDFFVTAAGSRPGDRSMQILYGIGGERRIDETELGHLDGYLGSRPVRVGNAAWTQSQLDVHGELLDAASIFAGRVERFDRRVASFLSEMADTAADRWEQPDSGIWEIRGEERHYLYSKLMCWVALDRAVKLAGSLHASAERVGHWCTERDRVRAAILERGWNDDAGAFTQSFGSSELDASALMMPIVGFLPAADPRVVATIDAIDRELTSDGGHVYRYRRDGDAAEGSFVIATFWMAHVLALRGDTAGARARFETAANCANDVALLPEEYDPVDREMLGNFPQAFSHIGLVNAAWAIAQAEAAGTTTRDVSGS